MSNLAIQKTNSGVIFVAKIVPGSSRTAICGLLNGMLKIKVAAAPEKGKANQCLLGFLATQLGIKKNAIRIIAGKNNPVKRLEVEGISPQALMEKLGLNAQRSY